MKQLYSYQEDLKANIAKQFRFHNKLIAQLPTGGGKGVIIADIARSAIEKGNVPCISVHRKEIFHQIYLHLREFGIFPGIIAQGEYPMGGHKCYLSMIETFCRRVNKGITDHLGINFFILDECHLGNYYKLIQSVDNKILGFTATPKSTGKPELKEYFDNIICGPDPSELIKIGRLSPCITFSIEHDFSKVKMKGGEFDDKSLFTEFKKPKLWTGAVKFYLQKAKGKQALCYNVNVEHSNEVTLQFRKAGIRAAHVDGKTPQEDRDAIFNMYRSGELDVICNVGIATTGTDLPETECIIQNFATTSIVKHIQTLGRGARTSDCKEKFIVIDMGRNYLRFGEFGEKIDWLDIFKNPKAATEKKENKTHKRSCDNCGAVMKFSLLQCPYCDHKIERKKLEKKLFSVASVEEVKQYRLKSVPVHLRKPTQEMNKSELMEYARHMNYNPKWVWTVLSHRNKKAR